MTDKVKNIVVSLLFFIIIFSIFIINVVKEEQTISLTERRELAKFPKITLSNIINGKFFNEFENFSMDQFISREAFRKLKANVEMKFWGKKDFNGIYEYNDVLIKQEYPLNEKSILNITKKMNQVQEKYFDKSNKVYYSIVPDKNYYADDKEYLKLDYNKLQEIMRSKLTNMQYIDIFDCLNLQDFYYTDTHWKQEKTLKVLDKISNNMNFENRMSKDFKEIEILDFKGVYSGQYPLETRKDTLKILTNEIIENAKVYNYDTKKETKVYDLEKVTSNDKYDIYLSGASSILKIENPNAETEKELIVFRDSFASSLVPLFIEGYKTITLVDIRYINLNLLKEFIEFENKDILFLYSTLIINDSYSIK